MIWSPGLRRLWWTIWLLPVVLLATRIESNVTCDASKSYKPAIVFRRTSAPTSEPRLNGICSKLRALRVVSGSVDNWIKASSDRPGVADPPRPIVDPRMADELRYCINGQSKSHNCSGKHYLPKFTEPLFWIHEYVLWYGLEKRMRKKVGWQDINLEHCQPSYWVTKKVSKWPINWRAWSG